MSTCEVIYRDKRDLSQSNINEIKKAQIKRLCGAT